MNKAYIYIIMSAFIFSTMEIAGKIVAYDINPFQLNFIRFLIGALVLLPFAVRDIKKRNVALGKNDLLYFLLTGFLCVIVSMSFFQLAIMYAKASTVAIIFSANPVFTIPFAGLLLKEKVTAAMKASLCVSLLGITCILNPFSVSIDIIGILLVVLSAVTFSLYSVIGKMRSAKYGSVANTCFSFLAGDLMLFLLMLVSNLPFFESLNLGKDLQVLVGIPFIEGINQGNILVVVYLGIVISGLGYLVYFLAMEKSSAGKASIVFFIKPALAPVLALIILGESIPLNTLAGIALIIAASCGTLAGGSRKPDNEGRT